MNYVRSTFALIVLFAAHPWNVQAGGTRIWELAGSAELQKGTLQGTALSSIGEIGIGLNPQKSPIDDDIGVVWSSAKHKNGNIFLGSGYNGKILRVADKEIVHVADTGQLVVTSIAFDKNGDLYAATLPEPAIWKISNPIKIQKGNRFQQRNGSFCLMRLNIFGQSFFLKTATLCLRARVLTERFTRLEKTRNRKYIWILKKTIFLL